MEAMVYSITLLLNC